MPIIVVCNVFPSFKAYGILREMPIIVVCNVFQERIIGMCFLREMPIIVVCNVFQERMAFYGKCLLSIVRKVFQETYGILREMPIIVVCNVFQERNRILREMPIIVVCNVFQERMAFYGKCLLSSFVMCFKSVWHFTGNAYYRRL